MGTAILREAPQVDPATAILKEAEEARLQLERNLEKLAHQQRVQQDEEMFQLLTTEDDEQLDVLRIRRQIDEAILKMQPQVQSNVNGKAKPDTEPQKSKRLNNPAPATYLRTVRGKVNHPAADLVTAKKTIVKKKVSTKSAKKKDEALDETDSMDAAEMNDLIFRHIYGNPPHHPHRSTIKPSQVRQSMIQS